jgi:hypothetical protein
MFSHLRRFSLFVCASALVAASSRAQADEIWVPPTTVTEIPTVT